MGLLQCGVAAIVFGFIPNSLEAAGKLSRGRCVALLELQKSMLGNGAICSHLGVIHAGGLRILHLGRLAEEVRRRRTDERLGAAVGGLVVVAANQHGRSCARFGHQEAGGAGELVANRDDGVMEFAAAEVGGAAQIEHRIEAGDTETNFGQAVADGRAVVIYPNAGAEVQKIAAAFRAAGLRNVRSY